MKILASLNCGVLGHRREDICIKANAYIAAQDQYNMSQNEVKTLISCCHKYTCSDQCDNFNPGKKDVKTQKIALKKVYKGVRMKALKKVFSPADNSGVIRIVGIALIAVLVCYWFSSSGYWLRKGQLKRRKKKGLLNGGMTESDEINMATTEPAAKVDGEVGSK